MDNEFIVKLLTETATVPTLGSKDSAGYDLYADTPERDITVPAHGKAIVKTGSIKELKPFKEALLDRGLSVVIDS